MPKVAQLVAGLNPRPPKSLVSVLFIIWQLEFNCTVSFSQIQWYLIDFSKTEELSRQCDIEQIIKTRNGVNGDVFCIQLHTTK